MSKETNYADHNRARVEAALAALSPVAPEDFNEALLSYLSIYVTPEVWDRAVEGAMGYPDWNVD